MEESYSGVTGTGMTPTDVTYTSTGARASITYANGITQTQTYNSDGSLKTLGQTGITGFPYTGYTDTYASGKIVKESFTGITGYSDGSFAVTAGTAPLTQFSPPTAMRAARTSTAAGSSWARSARRAAARSASTAPRRCSSTPAR